MIRRLHEIEPPPLALPSEKSNTTEDAATRESLASEFKKLLERARSGVAGVRDEVTALGFALSQAVSTARQQTEQIKQSAEDDGGDLDHLEDIACDEGQETDTSTQQVMVVDRSARVVAGPKVEEKDDSDQVDTDLEALDDELVSLEQDGEEIVLDDEVVYVDVEHVDLSEEVSIEDQTLAAQIVSQQLQTGQNQQVSDDFGDGEVDLSVESEARRVVLNADEEEEVDAGLDDFIDDDLVSQANNADLFRTQSKAKLTSARESEDYSTGDEDLDRFLAQYQVDSEKMSLGGDLDSQLRPALGDQRPGFEQEGLGLAQRREAPTFAPLSGVEGFAPSKDQNGELSMQLTLLRQAYDALKSQTMGMTDSKAKSSSSGVSGLGASAEPRAAQNEGAPRTVRYLNRAASQKMMERVENALKDAARSRDGKTITLRLEPLQLGQVKCDVSLRDGLLHARITPQNPEVVQAVRDHSHDLQTALRRLGLNVDRVTVQVLSEKESAAFANTPGFLDGKSFQESGHNMPEKQAQTPEKTFGNNFADVSAASTSDAGIAPADHWIA